MMVEIGKVCYERVKASYSVLIDDQMAQEFKTATESYYNCPDWFHDFEVTPELLGIVYGGKTSSDLYDKDKFEKADFSHEFPVIEGTVVNKYSFYDVVIEYFDEIVWEGEYEQFDCDTDYTEEYVDIY